MSGHLVKVKIGALVLALPVGEEQTVIVEVDGRDYVGVIVPTSDDPGPGVVIFYGEGSGTSYPEGSDPS